MKMLDKEMRDVFRCSIKSIFAVNILQNPCVSRNITEFKSF